MTQRTPIKLLELAGSPNLKRAKSYPPLPDKIKPLAGRPISPEHLTAEEKAIFERTADLLESRGTLTVGDGDALEHYAVVTVELRNERAELKKEGRIHNAWRKDKNSNDILVRAINPRTRVVDSLEKQSLQLLKELGLTPRHRKVKAAAAPEAKASDPMSELNQLLKAKSN